MAEPGNNEEQKKDLEGGLYIKKGKPFDAGKVSPIKLDEVSKKTGIDFEYDADRNEFTPKRYVVVPEKKNS